MTTAETKPKADRPSDDGLTQSERFMQAARELECDDDPDRFAERVKALGKPKLNSQIKEECKSE